MTPSGIEPATFWFVTQHLNHCATAVPRNMLSWLELLISRYCFSCTSVFQASHCEMTTAVIRHQRVTVVVWTTRRLRNTTFKCCTFYKENIPTFNRQMFYKHSGPPGCDALSSHDWLLTFHETHSCDVRNHSYHKHSVTSQKTRIFNHTTVRTPKLVEVSWLDRTWTKKNTFQFCVSMHHIMINKNTSLMQLISIYFTYSKSLHVSGRTLPIIRRIWYCTYQRLVLVR